MPQPFTSRAPAARSAVGSPMTRSLIVRQRQSAVRPIARAAMALATGGLAVLPDGRVALAAGVDGVRVFRVEEMGGAR
ncbi:MAG: hypothetical protein ABI780_14135 [Ardenticatenales bacterium]